MYFQESVKDRCLHFSKLRGLQEEKICGQGKKLDLKGIFKQSILVFVFQSLSNLHHNLGIPAPPQKKKFDFFDIFVLLCCKSFVTIGIIVIFFRIWKEYKDFDFMLKTDDDSFIVVENLKYLLQDFNPR